MIKTVVIQDFCKRDNENFSLDSNKSTIDNIPRNVNSDELLQLGLLLEFTNSTEASKISEWNFISTNGSVKILKNFEDIGRSIDQKEVLRITCADGHGISGTKNLLEPQKTDVSRINTERTNAIACINRTGYVPCISERNGILEVGNKTGTLVNDSDTIEVPITSYDSTDATGICILFTDVAGISSECTYVTEINNQTTDSIGISVEQTDAMGINSENIHAIGISSRNIYTGVISSRNTDAIEIRSGNTEAIEITSDNSGIICISSVNTDPIGISSENTEAKGIGSGNTDIIRTSSGNINTRGIISGNTDAKEIGSGNIDTICIISGFTDAIRINSEMKDSKEISSEITGYLGKSETDNITMIQNDNTNTELINMEGSPIHVFQANSTKCKGKALKVPKDVGINYTKRAERKYQPKHKSVPNKENSIETRELLAEVHESKNFKKQAYDLNKFLDAVILTNEDLLKKSGILLQKQKLVAEALSYVSAAQSVVRLSTSRCLFTNNIPGYIKAIVEKPSNMNFYEAGEYIVENLKLYQSELKDEFTNWEAYRLKILHKSECIPYYFESCNSEKSARKLMHEITSEINTSLINMEMIHSKREDKNEECIDLMDGIDTYIKYSNFFIQGENKLTIL